MKGEERESAGGKVLGRKEEEAARVEGDEGERRRRVGECECMNRRRKWRKEVE